MEYRAARPEERDAYIELANYAFGFDAERLLPKVYAPSMETSSIHRVAVHETGKLCAEVAVLPQSMTICGKELKIGFLGMVSVHPKFRRQGHMKRLMDMWLQEAQGQYDMLVLYGQRQRYEYFGFTGGGMRRQYLIEKPNVHHCLQNVAAEGITFCPFFEVPGAAAFAEQYNLNRMSYIERKAEDMAGIFSSLNQTPTAVLKNGALIGYIISDASGEEISEFAVLSLSYIKPVVKAYFAWKQCGHISIHVPDYERKVNEILGEFAERYEIDYDCMYHILDYAKILEAYLTLKHASIGLSYGEFSAVMDGQEITARVDENGVCVERSAKPDAIRLDKQQAQSLLLTEYSRFHKLLVPKDWFPLPAFWYIVDKF